MSRVDKEEYLVHLEQRAVKAAGCCQWTSAINYNLQILKIKPDNTSALNRLGKAYWEDGQIDKAKTSFEKSLKVDPSNGIAFKNLERLKDLKNTPVSPPRLATNRAVFLEEPGITKIVRLTRLASGHVLSELDCADEVFLRPRNRLVNVVNQKGIYLGCLPEDLSFRLIKLIKRGNRYQAFIRLIDARNLHLLVREVKRSTRLHNTPSFLFIGVLFSMPIRAFA